MRVIVLSESPGADGLASEFVEAARAFNRGLDIRLRFLDVGFEIRSFSVPAAGDFRAEALDELLASFRPGAVLVLGGGPRLLECAATAAKAGPPLAYFLNGEADRPAQAIAELAGIVVGPGPEHPARPRDDALTITLEAGRPAGPALVDILVRSVRERRS